MCRLFWVSTVLRAAFGPGSGFGSVRACRIGFSLAIALPMLASTAVAPFDAGNAQACAPPQLVVGPAVDIARQETPFNLRVGGQPDCLPANSYLYIQGLPPGAALSAGERDAPGNWFVDLPALEQLTIKVPQGFAGSSDVVITLFDGAGGVLAERTVPLHARSAVGDVAQAQQKSDITTSALPAPAHPSGEQKNAAPERRARSPAELAQAERLVAHGRYYFAHGDIAVARQYFGRAAELGLPLAAFKLAETHDPHELSHIGVQGLRPDPGEARKWYQRALQLGMPEADARLQRLGTARDAAEALNLKRGPAIAPDDGSVKSSLAPLPADRAQAEPLSSSVCALAVQGKVPFGHKGSNAWDATSLAQLCRNAETSAEPAKCFDQLMRGQFTWGRGKIWMASNALTLCAGTRGANETLDCFTKTVAAGQTWRSAIERCRFK